MTTATLHKTVLKDRVLYSDGDSVVPADKLMTLISSGKNTNGICVNSITTDIRQFNKLVSIEEQIQTKSVTRPNDLSWKLPQEYTDIDVEDYVLTQFFNNEQTEGFKYPRPHKSLRITNELAMYANLNLYPILRVLIYIINTLRKKNIVWGIGRGSSVSSYVLYIMGVHDVDSEEYDLDIHDFLRI